MKVKNDHCSYNLSNWKEEALILASSFQLLKIGKLTVMIILHFHLQPQFKYELFHIYFTSGLLVIVIGSRNSPGFLQLPFANFIVAFLSHLLGDTKKLDLSPSRAMGQQIS